MRPNIDRPQWLIGLFGRAGRAFARGESGLAQIGTAILLLALVNGGSVLAYVVMEDGGSLAAQADQTIRAALAEARTGLMVRGSVVVIDANGDRVINGGDAIVVPLSTLPAGAPVVFDPEDTAAPVVTFSDRTIRSSNVPYSLVELRGNDDAMIEAGELFEMTIHVPEGVALTEGHEFILQVAPPGGAVLTLYRSIPLTVSRVNVLY